MCGIVGFVSKNRDDYVVKKMLKVINYRGPDDNGIFVKHVIDKFIHLGHNRLSIQDLTSKGHQPFISDCGNFIIVFNGEVYNFKLIRLELENLGYKFFSDTDTEVILYAYKEWGISSINKFIGMFAFSILDLKKQKIILVRDRAGVKPLYFYSFENEFFFASELKSFHEHPLFIKKQNIDILTYYFQFGYIPAPHTIYKNTYKLEPGNYLEYDIKTKSYNIIKYWDVDKYYKSEKINKSEDRILDDLENLLDDAVNLRMISDVPVGIFLSGGYDSSLLTALLSKNKNNKLNTFTIGFDEKKYNESLHAKNVAKHFGTNHSEFHVTKKDMLNKIESLPFYYDEPFGDSSAIPTILVSEFARKKVTVALSADGGDEAFCGYSKYFFLNKLTSVFSNKFNRLIFKNISKIFNANHIETINEFLPKKIKQTNIYDKYIKYKRAINSSSIDKSFLNASSSTSSELIKNFLKIDSDKLINEKFMMNKNLSYLDNMMLIDYKTFMVDDVLTKVDRASMSTTLEGREPLLDHRIIEFMSRIPEEIKYKNNEGKYLSRKILYKYAPRSLVDKPKTGFQVPLFEWLTTGLKPLVEKYLDSSKINSEIFNLEEVQKIKINFFNGDKSYTNVIWFILMYEMWYEKWFK